MVNDTDGFITAMPAFPAFQFKGLSGHNSDLASKPNFH